MFPRFLHPFPKVGTYKVQIERVLFHKPEGAPLDEGRMYVSLRVVEVYFGDVHEGDWFNYWTDEGKSPKFLGQSKKFMEAVLQRHPADIGVEDAVAMTGEDQPFKGKQVILSIKETETEGVVTVKWEPVK